MSALPIATNLYFDNHFKLPGVKLLPNEFYMTGENMVLVTVLGSCVAACITDRTAGIGGMNHFMLPDDGADASQSSSDSMRYGAYAMEVLINEMIKRGGRRERFEAKVFGGGAVLANMTLLNIGERNADFVLRYLQMEQVRVAAQDLRGNYPRRINYFPVTGKVTMRKLRQQDDVALVQNEERQLAATLSKPARGGGVEIFNVDLARDVANKNAWAL